MVQKKSEKILFNFTTKNLLYWRLRKNLNKDVIYKRKKTLQKSAIFCEVLLKFTKLIFLP